MIRSILFLACLSSLASAFVPDTFAEQSMVPYFSQVGFNTNVKVFPTHTRTIRYGIDAITPGLFETSGNVLSFDQEINLWNRPNCNTTVEFVYDYEFGNYPLIDTDIFLHVTKYYYSGGLRMWVNFTTDADETYTYDLGDISEYMQTANPSVGATSQVVTVYLNDQQFLVKQFVFGFSNTFYGPAVPELYPSVLSEVTLIKFLPASEIEEHRDANYLLHREVVVEPYVRWGGLAVDTYPNTSFVVPSDKKVKLVVRFPPRTFKKKSYIVWDVDSFDPGNPHTVQFGYLKPDGRFVRLALWKSNKQMNQLPRPKLSRLQLNNMCLIIDGAGNLMQIVAN